MFTLAELNTEQLNGLCGTAWKSVHTETSLVAEMYEAVVGFCWSEWTLIVTPGTTLQYYLFYTVTSLDLSTSPLLFFFDIASWQVSQHTRHCEKFTFYVLNTNEV